MRSAAAGGGERGWEFWIDRGGTFTDVIGLAPDAALHAVKVLSDDAAPLAGMRAILAAAGADLESAAPSVALGTTVATNALLERRGARVALVANRGLAGVFDVGTQERPDLFALRIERPPPLHARAIEAAGRVACDGARLEAHDDAALDAALAAARAAGCDAVAAVSIHAHAHPEDETRWRDRARAAGIPYAVASHEVARELGLLARGETALADAYLTPLLQRHVAALAAALPHARLRFMQSSGGLTDAARFRGPNALLSGPAGGAVAAARVAQAAGRRDAIGFDMGGTSTDVSLLRDGRVDRSFESEVAGVRVRAPMLHVHTIAAGGGSLCRFDGFTCSVGPESAGADPGPLCYGLRDAAGNPAAHELTLTDVNHFLGRLPGARFPLPLERAPVERALAAMQRALRRAGHDLDLDGVAAGFVAIANAQMAQAIQRVSVERGVDPRGCALVGFGGAAGQHVCAVARALGVRSVLLHPLAGLLSALGIGVAERSWDGQGDAGRAALGREGRAPRAVDAIFAALEAEGRAALAAEGVPADRMRVERRLDLRYAGNETPVDVAEPADRDWLAAFTAAHRARYGYTRERREVEIATARVRVAAPASSGAEAALRAPPPGAPARGAEMQETWFPGLGRARVPHVDREALGPGDELAGPAIVREASGTLAVDPGWAVRVAAGGVLELVDRETARAVAEDAPGADPVRLAVLGARFMSIAEQMGAVLRNTAVSTNIKERRDYSCAVFDAGGGLVANAPHVPVHLGAMEETVRALRDAFPGAAAGDVWVTNDPFRGGSHLPDVTVVTPVFAPGAGAPFCFVGSRGHHADIGGRAPGSMPAASTRLEEEGVVLAPHRLVARGAFDEPWVRARLAAGPWPARNPDDNVADLEAMVAANRAGAALLGALHDEVGDAALASGMRGLQESAAAHVWREVERRVRGVHAFADRLDDGTPVAVRIERAGDRLVVDFAGTGAAVAGNRNAPRAVVRAAVLYVLRALVAERMPLNGGCLKRVELRVPPGSLLDPPPGAAVVGGNVETSQRIVDVLLGALGLAAASQGTMNNVAFGDDRFGYYETIGGGAGAGPGFDGASGVHVHMTNTRITDAEVLELRHPVRLERFAVRTGSGGAGRFRGGDGLVRRYAFTAPVRVSILSERRRVAPWGLAGGAPGARGRNAVERADGRIVELAGGAEIALGPGDRLVVETPGGGGYGRKRSAQRAEGERSP
jgi:5-oxoprolinase (ATP-hydrolysing)